MGDRLQSRSQPQFLQRSRSSSGGGGGSGGGGPRPCHACTAPAEAPTPFSPNLPGTTTRSPAPRSKSAAKPRSTSSSSSSSKENREMIVISPSPRTTLNNNNSNSNSNNNNAAAINVGKQPTSPRPWPSAWALSPGRSPEPRGTTATAIELAEERKKKKSKGMMGFLTRSRRKEPSEREEAAHRMRMIGCRLLQWRFVNARRERAMARVRSTAERKLFFAWLRINELRNIVTAKRIVIQRKKHKLKLARVLNPQIHFLNQWEPNSKRHAEVVSALSRVLEAACLPVPLVHGAQTQVDLVLLHSYISTSMEIMVEIEAAVRIFYSKVEEVSTILGELAETVTLAMKGIEELIETSQRITTMEMHETSLRANLIQALKKEIEPPPLSALRLQSWMQSHQWPIY